MKKTVLFGLLVILLVFAMTVVGCDNDSTNGNDTSAYAGEWVDLGGNGRKIVINNNGNFTIWLVMDAPAAEAIRGTVKIDGTAITLTYTSITNSQGGWTSAPSDLAQAAAFLGTSPRTGTVNGSTAGSTIIVALLPGNNITFTKQ
jgi:hypothetical protein